MTKTIFKITALAVFTIFSVSFFTAPIASSHHRGPYQPIIGDAFIINNCSPKAKFCDDFTVNFAGTKIKAGDTGVICWLGKCKKARNNAPTKEAHLKKGLSIILIAKYINIRPQRCGSQTTVTLYHKGKKHVRKGEIRCR